MSISGIATSTLSQYSLGGTSASYQSQIQTFSQNLKLGNVPTSPTGTQSDNILRREPISAPVAEPAIFHRSTEPPILDHGGPVAPLSTNPGPSTGPGWPTAPISTGNGGPVAPLSTNPGPSTGPGWPTAPISIGNGGPVAPLSTNPGPSSGSAQGPTAPPVPTIPGEWVTNPSAGQQAYTTLQQSLEFAFGSGTIASEGGLLLTPSSVSVDI